VTAVLLKYRVPARQGQPRYQAPLQDAQRAVSLVRQRAPQWGLDPKRIGIMGFSAGAHLSAVTSCRFEQRAYEPVDGSDQASCRPDFVMLIYPAYLAVQKEGDKIAPELTVTSNTPPTFLTQTQDDVIRVECSVAYYLALKNARVPVEMHLYSSGGHGYGLRPSKLAVTTWPERAEQWMRGLGVLDRTY
jgi:acetyl esterase/lipase